MLWYLDISGRVHQDVGMSTSATAQRRFLVVRLHGNNVESLGTTDQHIMSYASVASVIRHGLAKPGVRPGQYHIYPLIGGRTIAPPTVAFKRA